MSKQIKAQYAGDWKPHLRDITPGKVYQGEALEVGEINHFDRTSETGDEFQFVDDSGDVVVSRLSFGWELVED